MQPQNSEIENRGNEASLVELLHVFFRRKVLILATFLAGLAAGSGYVTIKKPVYEASAKLRIGQVADIGVLEAGDQLSLRLLVRYGENIADGVKRERPFLNRAITPKNAGGIIEIFVEAAAPDAAVDLLQRVIADVQKDHENSYQRNIELLNQRIRDIDAQRAALATQYQNGVNLVERLSSSDSVQATLLVQEQGRVAALISSLDTERFASARRLVPPQTRPTEVLNEIVAPVKPIAPKKVLIILLGATFGFMAGLLLAIIAEAIVKIRHSI